tara:strand:- start:7002 stop:7151 length:150 start_codon:yes stop_codon:yes gene_type:complete
VQVIVTVQNHAAKQRLNARRQQLLRSLVQKVKNKKGFDYTNLGVNSAVV